MQGCASHGVDNKKPVGTVLWRTVPTGFTKACPGKEVGYWLTEAAMASAKASISPRFCSWRAAAMVRLSSKITIS